MKRNIMHTPYLRQLKQCQQDSIEFSERNATQILDENLFIFFFAKKDWTFLKIPGYSRYFRDKDDDKDNKVTY